MAEKRIRVKIDGDARGLTQATRQGESAIARFGRIGTAGFAAVAGAAAALTAGAIDAVKAAAEEQQAQALLADALRKTAGATDEVIASTEDWIDTVKLGSTFADDDLRPALANLVRVTGDVAAAQTLLTAAMDVAVGSGKPLETVVAAVSKAYTGNETALRKLIPGLELTNVKQGDAAGLAQTLATRFGGADRAASNTASGGLQDLDDILADLKETVGEQLLPELEDFVDWARSPDGQNAISDMAGAIGALGRAFGTLATQLGNLSREWDELPQWLRNLLSRPLWEQWRPPWENSRAAAAGPPTVYGGPAALSATRSSTTTINVAGVLDPVAQANTVRRALLDNDVRLGRIGWTP